MPSEDEKDEDYDPQQESSEPQSTPPMQSQHGSHDVSEQQYQQLISCFANISTSFISVEREQRERFASMEKRLKKMHEDMIAG